MILALRKFLNLLLSFLLFDNVFTQRHFFAIALVFLGTMEFYEVFTKICNKFEFNKQKKQK